MLQFLTYLPNLVSIPVGTPDALEHRSIAVKPCGADCLLARTAEFVCAIPRHEGRRGYLFRTNKGTLIKSRKRTGSEMLRVFGTALPVGPCTQRGAFELLREHQPAGITVPLRECRCSYEVQFVNGVHLTAGLINCSALSMRQ